MRGSKFPSGVHSFQNQKGWYDRLKQRPATYHAAVGRLSPDCLHHQRNEQMAALLKSMLPFESPEHPAGGHPQRQGRSGGSRFCTVAKGRKMEPREFSGSFAATPIEAVRDADFVFRLCRLVAMIFPLRHLPPGPDGAFLDRGEGCDLHRQIPRPSAESCRRLDARSAKARLSHFIDAPVSAGRRVQKQCTDGHGFDAEAVATREPVIDTYTHAGGSASWVQSAQAGCKGDRKPDLYCQSRSKRRGLAEGIHFSKKAGLDIRS